MSGEASKARANERRNTFLSICGLDSLKPPATQSTAVVVVVTKSPFYFNYTRKPRNTIFCSMIIRENSNLYHP